VGVDGHVLDVLLADTVERLEEDVAAMCVETMALRIAKDMMALDHRARF
jgi:hypothetical protein